MLQRNPEPNRIYILSRLENFTERQSSFGGIYKTASELIFDNKEFNKNDSPPKFIKDRTLSGFSKFKVVNRFKVLQAQDNEYEKCKNEQHGRAQKTYSIIIDAKYIKIFVKRSYRSENLYEYFRNLFQVMNTTFLELESMPPNEKFNVRSVKRILSTSKFNRKAMEARFPKHGNRRRQINKMFDSIYKSLTLTVVLLSLNLLSI